MSNNIQPPLFTSASQNPSDDFDFHEVFADYFVSEFEDPLNAYVGGIANYQFNVSSIPMSNDGSSDPNAKKPSAGGLAMALPTGGIRTAFHQATAPPPVSQDQPGGAPKKIKTEDETSAMQQLQLSSAEPNQILSASSATQQPCGSDTAANHPGASSQSGDQAGVVPKVALPVGVGIRFGNIAPATQQQSMIQIPGLQFNQGATGDNNNATLTWNLFNKHANEGSETAMAERRERNREHAKRSRIRKKFILESLQEQVRQLQRENGSLRLLVQEHIPDHAMQIFDECCMKNPLFAGQDDYDIFGQLGEVSPPTPSSLVRSDFSLMACLSSGQKCFTLSDPKLPDNPIVYATPAFYEMTGYTAKEVLGRNCRFLQGPGTDKKSVEILRKSVQSGADATICLLNYKADGTPFWNQLFVAPLRDSDNCIVNYVGVQTEVEPESATPSYLEDKVNSVLPLQGKDDMDDD